MPNTIHNLLSNLLHKDYSALLIFFSGFMSLLYKIYSRPSHPWREILAQVILAGSITFFFAPWIIEAYQLEVKASCALVWVMVQIGEKLLEMLKNFALKYVQTKTNTH